MIRKTDAVVVRTIGIDTSKNTPHLIGLDDKGAIVLREKLSRGRIAARLANGAGDYSICLPGHGDVLLVLLSPGFSYRTRFNKERWTSILPLYSIRPNW
ncbi:MAG: hypothetical protein ACLPKT_08100, partial [Methylocella sp.]